MTRYKTPNVRHSPPQRRHSKIYFLAKHLKIFALNDAGEGEVSSSDTIPICLVLWICWLTLGCKFDELTLFVGWCTEPENCLKIALVETELYFWSRIVVFFFSIYWNNLFRKYNKEILLSSSLICSLYNA